MQQEKISKIVLVGQPNSGKSTLFNAVAGYRTIASNFPGTTVSFISTPLRFRGMLLELVDLPGTYSLAGCEPAEKITLKYLQENQADLIINVMDASMLSRSLDLTLEIMELGFPLIICLNMLDEAKRKGLQIDIPLLSQILQVPVVGTIASKGEGIDQLFDQVQKNLQALSKYPPPRFSQDVEIIIQQLRETLQEIPLPLKETSFRFFLLKLLENEPEVVAQLKKIAPEKIPALLNLQKILAEQHNRSSSEVVCSERHALALNIFEKVAKLSSRAPENLTEKLDFWLMHKYLGYFFLALILFLLFAAVFWLGKIIEAPLLKFFNQLQLQLTEELGTGFLGTILLGLLQGFSGGIAIFLPYLVPFLIGLSLLEDIGYLPRTAFLMDTFMHRIGLHGKAVIPFVLGYGCNVPAVMAVQTMENPHERFFTGILSTMIPCAARTTVIFALTGYLLGPGWALFLYIFNLFIIALIGNILTRFQPDPSEGLIMEVPTYKMPVFKPLLKKVWFRLREFVIVAWPILILGSVILSLLDFFHLADLVNKALSPLVVSLLGLPEKVGTTLIFGIFRKELTLIMLSQALGTTEFLNVMTKNQILVFTTFVLFYIPCVATLAALYKQIHLKGIFASIALTLSVATIIGVFFRLIFRGI